MADNPYINKVEANNQTLIDLTSDTATAGDVLEGRTLHLASGAPAVGTYRPSDEIEARLEATVGHSCKNLMPITLESGTYTEGGANLTYTINKVAGTITLNGTTRTSGAGYITVYEDTNGEISGNLYVSGGYSDNCYIRVYDYTESPPGYVKNWNGESSRGSKGENDSDEETLISGHRNAVRIRFTAGQTFTNVVIKPMIRSGSISDDTFEPYVTPTDEKKQDKPVVLWEATTKSEMTEQVTFPTAEIENIGYFIVFVEVKSEDAVVDVVTFIVYNGMLFGELNYYHNISTTLTFAIEEGIAGISVETTDIPHEPKIIKIVGIPK